MPHGRTAVNTVIELFSSDQGPRGPWPARTAVQSHETWGCLDLGSLGRMTDTRRGVGAIRLSNVTEETTSPARQKESEQAWASTNDVEIIGWAEDIDVSAGISPWDRPELGAWLARPNDFDLLIFAKLDRAVRSLRDFVDLMQWCEDNTVTLVVLDPPLDLTTIWGRAMAGVLAVFAELERGMIKERTAEGYVKLLKMSRWPGGRIHFCYEKIKGKEGWYLQPNQERAALIQKVVSEIFNGSSVQAQELKLEELGIKTSTGKTHWGNGALHAVLRSRSLLGQRPTGNDVARDARGLPIEYAQPIIDQATWDRLQAVLKANGTRTTGARRDSAPLLRVAFCGVCQAPFHRQGHNKGWKYYQCSSVTNRKLPGCGSKPFRADEMEAVIYGEFLGEVGPLEVQNRVYVPGEEHTEALETAQRAYEELTEQLTTTRSSSGRKALSDRLTELDELIADLETQPNRPASWRYEGTGQTYQELWDSMTGSERGALLRQTGVSARVLRASSGLPHVYLVLPNDIRERLQNTRSSSV